LAFRRFLFNREDRDMGHILENVVFLELLHRGYKVSVGKIGAYEVDFVAQALNENLEYYQVSQSILDKNTFEREIQSLDKIDDHHPKCLLSMDYSDLSYKGIKHINILDWLMGG